MSAGTPRVYEGEHLTGIALPVGGLGAGSVFIDGAGRRLKWFLWEAWTRATLANSFFAVRVRTGKGAPVVRALQTEPVDELPGLHSLSFTGEYPFGCFAFHDDVVPVQLRMETYNPLAPQDLKTSGMPCAIYNLTAENTGREPVEVSFLAAQQNAVGFRKGDEIQGNACPGFGGNHNAVRTLRGATVISMTSDRPNTQPEAGSMALIAMEPHASATAAWESLSDLLRDFAGDGRVRGPQTTPPTAAGQTVSAALAVPFVLPPGQKQTVTFALAWHFPHVRQNWGSMDGATFWSQLAKGSVPSGFWVETAAGQQYANWWADADAVAEELVRHLPDLERQTRLFHDTLYTSNLPRWLLDGLSSQIAILRSPVCFWNGDGYFGCYEGFRERENVEYDRDGNCNHVLQYAQLHAYLFPALARALRDSEFALMRPDGALSHRHTAAYHGPVPALDGSCGAVLGSYREYRMSADRAWLDRVWPKVKAVMDHAIATWDPDEDGVLSGDQHNTMDGSVSGSTTWMGAIYLAALAAAERLALIEDNPELAGRYRSIRLSGSEKQDATLFNGEYYIQLGGTQIGTGCATDQLLGQWWAQQLNLGWLYPAEHVRTALQNLLRYNYHSSFVGVPRQRLYASDPDAGLEMVTWPKGQRPNDTFFHVDQCWAGSEYALAALLIQAGRLEDGLKVAKSVRDRYNGRARPEWTFAPGGNPFGEVEWGMFYTRSLSIWSLLTACQGFLYDGPAGVIGFDPVWQPDDHASFFTVAEGWGLYTQRREPKGQAHTVTLRHGRLVINELRFTLPAPSSPLDIRVDCGLRSVDAASSQEDRNVLLRLAKPLSLRAGDRLTVRIGIPEMGERQA